MNPLAPLIRLDDRISATIEDGYLALYDATGIYVANLAAIVLVAAIACLTEFDDAFSISTSLIAILPGMSGLVRLYRFQHSGDLAAYNRRVERWRNASIRFPVIFASINSALWCLLTSVIYQNWEPLRLAGAFVLLCLLFYMVGIRLREREPPSPRVPAAAGA